MWIVWKNQSDLKLLTTERSHYIVFNDFILFTYFGMNFTIFHFLYMCWMLFAWSFFYVLFVLVHTVSAYQIARVDNLSLWWFQMIQNQSWMATVFWRNENCLDHIVNSCHLSQFNCLIKGHQNSTITIARLQEKVKVRHYQLDIIRT